MEFAISSVEINEVVKKMGKILTAKTTMPILSGVLVEAKSDCILFTASDGFQSIIHRVLLAPDDVEVLVEGKSVFPKETFDISRKLKGNISFKATETNLNITKDKTNFDFAVMDATEYPAVSIEPNSKPIIISGTVFSKVVAKTTFATSKQDTRPILRGVNFEFGSERNVITATDSHRLSRVETEGTHSDENLSVAVPATILDHASKAFDLTQDVMIFPYDQSIALANGSTILTSSLLEGKYPDTSRLMPLDFQSNVVVNRQELIDGLELIQTISPMSVVDFTINGMFVELSANGTGTKGVKELVYESYDGEEDFSLSFSAQYVLDALRRMDETSVRFRFNGNLKPFIIVSVNDNYDDIQLVLPVRQQ